MGCSVAPAWPFDCFCIEPLCGPYANEVDARYQHLEGLHVQLQVPVMLSILLVWVMHLPALCTWDTASFVSTCDLSFSTSERQVKIFFFFFNIKSKLVGSTSLVSPQKNNSILV
ncbi:hypothetical protein VPH35_044474 [Triticum aestivum]